MFTRDEESTESRLAIIVFSLATGQGEIKERLWKTFVEHNTLSKEDFPPDLQGEWELIIRKMTRKGPLKDHNGTSIRSSYENTMRQYKKMTGSKIATKIVDLYIRLKQKD